MWRKEDLDGALRELRLERYSNLLIHANLALSGICETSPSNPQDVFLDAMQNIVANKSNFFLPAFTYSFGNGHTFKPFSDYGLKAMGSVSQAGWKRGYYRTLDPMFSLLGFGSNVPKLASQHSVNSSHGEGSLFARLVDENVGLVLVNVGCATTLIHELEYRLSVTYRFLKEFVGYCQFTPNDNLELIKWKAFVNKREIPNSGADFTTLNRDIFSDSNITKVKFGKGYIVHFDINFLSSFLKIKMQTNPWYVTKHGQFFMGSEVP